MGLPQLKVQLVLMTISQLNENLSKELNQLKVSILLLRSIHYPIEGM